MIPNPTPWQSNEQTGQPIFKPGSYLSNPNQGIVSGSSGSGVGVGGSMGGQSIEDQVLRISAECQRYLEGTPSYADCQRRLEEAVALRNKIQQPGAAGRPNQIPDPRPPAPSAPGAGTGTPGTPAPAPAGTGNSNCDGLIATLERLTVMYNSLRPGSTEALQVWKRMLEVHTQMEMCARTADRDARRDFNVGRKPQPSPTQPPGKSGPS